MQNTKAENKRAYRVDLGFFHLFSTVKILFLVNLTIFFYYDIMACIIIGLEMNYETYFCD